ncbi:MAG: hypothetical protein ACD_34C00195G0003 [uncultured bacterium]|nr:MAG: hypothetical protein ACD_34C00195G0003 [uncultured bacterium]
MRGRRLVNKKAVAAGVTSMATIKATPTICMDTATVMAIRTNKRLLRNLTGRRKVAASSGSNETTTNCL